MNQTLIPALGIFALIAIFGTAAYVRIARKPQLTPFQQIFEDAKVLILKQGLFATSFTPNYREGIGEPTLPHCIVGAVAASDPTFNRDSATRIFSLASVQHLMSVSRLRAGMTPTAVNDTLGLDAVLELLDWAIEESNH
jgi:hypothetical protein